jgi:chromosomal replication initiator protein
MDSNPQLWRAVLGNLEVNLSKANFTTWFKNTSILEHSQNKIIVGVPNAFTKEWLKNKYHKDIVEAVRIIEPDVQEVLYQITSSFSPNISAGGVAETKNSPLPARSATVVVARPPVSHSPQEVPSGLNPRYVFDNFVVGSNNELAAAAAQAVVKSLGKSYNPLFIYGGVGLGKTHLMQAIGNSVVKANSGTRVLYVTTEKFTNEFIKALRDNRGDGFKNIYRGVDLLLIDDIQFLAKKEQTQEEFFHTFNALHQSNKQIVLSSDRLPKEIPAIEERLVSRFEWGMIADVQPPDFETRLAILRSKTRERGYQVDDDILEYLAQTIETNIRELEGSLNRLMVYCQLNGANPTMERVKSILSTIIFSPKRRGVSPKKIMEVVADFYNVSVEDLIRKSRKKEYVVPRQIAMYIIRKELETSLPMIGDLFGGRDHTTVIHAVDKIQGQAKEKEALKHELSLITDKIYAD